MHVHSLATCPSSCPKGWKFYKACKTDWHWIKKMNRRAWSKITAKTAHQALKKNDMNSNIASTKDGYNDVCNTFKCCHLLMQVFSSLTFYTVHKRQWNKSYPLIWIFGINPATPSKMLIKTMTMSFLVLKIRVSETLFTRLHSPISILLLHVFHPLEHCLNHAPVTRNLDVHQAHDTQCHMLWMNCHKNTNASLITVLLMGITKCKCVCMDINECAHNKLSHGF